MCCVGCHQAVERCLPFLLLSGRQLPHLIRERAHFCCLRPINFRLKEGNCYHPARCFVPAATIRTCGIHFGAGYQVATFAAAIRSVPSGRRRRWLGGYGARDPADWHRLQFFADLLFLRARRWTILLATGPQCAVRRSAVIFIGSAWNRC